MSHFDGEEKREMGVCVVYERGGGISLCDRQTLNSIRSWLVEKKGRRCLRVQKRPFFFNSCPSFSLLFFLLLFSSLPLSPLTTCSLFPTPSFPFDRLLYIFTLFFLFYLRAHIPRLSTLFIPPNFL
ncbi:MAG: hypothetical protein JOS17DRAFT_559714 [Linnemannia elongata]|nr:MAG: hypothetical protein JOS17DRAFT_559714 [Linnemannia elongata]